MKIAVIFTGGTIGSRTNNGFLSPDDKCPYLLLENYKEKFGDVVEFVKSEPYTSLSETLNSQKLNLLIDEVNLKAREGVDGIIVTHGTDTLQYSAAALSLTVEPSLPICIVSSNYSLDDDRANGNDNFMAAVELIKSGEKGVFIAYRNSDGVVYYHQADKLLRHREMSDEIFSVGGPYGKLVDGRVEFFQKNNTKAVVKGAHFVKTPGILSITATPEDGFNYGLDGVKAVLLSPYHSGTLDVDSPSFGAFCYQAASRQIPIFVADVLDGDQYATSKKFSELRIISLNNEPSVSAFVKMWLAVSLDRDVKAFMCENPQGC